MLIRLRSGVSLDGFMATPDGMPALDAMPNFTPGQSYGTGEFLEQCGAVVVGRTTFDFGYSYWSEQGIWPWEGYQVFVLTSRPLPAKLPPGVVASQDGPAGLVEQLRSAELAGDVHLLGGAQTLKALYQLGAINRLEVLLLPILLGKGVPLFPLGEAQQSLCLESQQTFPDGTVNLVYTVT